MQILHHSLLVKKIFVSVNWKYLCLKPTEMGIYVCSRIYALFYEKLLSGQFCIVSITFCHIIFFPFLFFPVELANNESSVSSL